MRRVALKRDTVVEAAPTHISTDLDGEIVMLELERGEYFSVSGVGAYLWRLLERPRSLEDLVAAVTQEYDVDEGVCLPDVFAFVEDLLSGGLLRIVDSTSD
jgi:hypothetical protein